MHLASQVYLNYLHAVHCLCLFICRVLIFFRKLVLLKKNYFMNITRVFNRHFVRPHQLQAKVYALISC